MKKSLLVCAALLASTGCTHRPYYRELAPRAGGSAERPVTAAPGAVLPVRLVDPQSGAALEGVSVRFGEGRTRVQLKSDAQGLVLLPVSTALWDANPLVEVSRSSGGGYDFAPVAPASPGSAEPAAQDAGSAP